MANPFRFSNSLRKTTKEKIEQFVLVFLIHILNIRTIANSISTHHIDSTTHIASQRHSNNMLPRRIMAVATASQRTMSVAQHLRLRETVMPVSLTRFRRLCFSSQSDGEVTPGKQEEHDAGDRQDLQQQEQDQEQHQEIQINRRPHQQSGNEKAVEKDTRSAKQKKWRAPFWLPPPSTSEYLRNKKGPRFGNRNGNHNSRPNQRLKIEKRKIGRYRDASLPCRQHLEEQSGWKEYPTSDWVQIFGALPMTSLNEVLDSIENILRKEASETEASGIIDLDALWNPHVDGESLPLVPSILEIPIQDLSVEERPEYLLDEDTSVSNSNSSHENKNENEIENENENLDDSSTMPMESFRVLKAHVNLSPFGRPTGWNLKLANPSMVQALLSVAQNNRVRGSIRIGWKFVKINEHHPPKKSSSSKRKRRKKGQPLPYDLNDTRTMLVVSDSMVRFENCPQSLTADYLRHKLSRYELTQKGSTIIEFKGRVSNGETWRITPLTYVVRFASPAFARAAVRELQGRMIEGRRLKLIQYPKQLL